MSAIAELSGLLLLIPSFVARDPQETFQTTLRYNSRLAMAHGETGCFRQLELEDMDRAAAVHRVSFDHAPSTRALLEPRPFLSGARFYVFSHGPPSTGGGATLLELSGNRARVVC